MVRALLLGATGETGREVLKCLRESQHFDKVVLVGRRKVDGLDEEQKVRPGSGGASPLKIKK